MIQPHLTPIFACDWFANVPRRSSRQVERLRSREAVRHHRLHHLGRAGTASWSAAARADSPASSIMEATVLRHTWLVIQP
jgi:hypothetical protein